MQMISSHWKHQVDWISVIDPDSPKEVVYQTDLVVAEAVNLKLAWKLNGYWHQRLQLSKHEPKWV